MPVIQGDKYKIKGMVFAIVLLRELKTEDGRTSGANKYYTRWMALKCCSPQRW